MILAPTLTLSAGSGAAIVRPTFSRDFAGEKSLNNGTGPAITFTRASNATFFNASGTLQTASNDVPRFDHDPATGASRGLLIEESRTNSIRNSQAGGSTNGVLGSGGVGPTNWSLTPNGNGVTTEIIGTGTEDGLAYIDMKVSGTPTASSGVQINFESATQIVAANSQTWTTSAYVKLAAGATTNATIDTVVLGRTSAGAGVSGQQTVSAFAPTSSALKTQRREATRSFTDATVERVQSRVTVNYTSGNPIDLTLRIAAPQLEQGAFPTSYIPTTNAAATRSADSAIVTPISGFYNQSEGTLFAEFQSAVTGNRIAVSVDDASNNNRVQIGAGSGNVNQPITGIAAQGVSQFFTTYSNISSQPFRIIMAMRANDSQTVVNSTAQTAVTSLTMPSPNRMVIGRDRLDSAHTNGHIRKIAYYPRRLSNTLLQQLTT